VSKRERLQSSEERTSRKGCASKKKKLERRKTERADVTQRKLLKCIPQVVRTKESNHDARSRSGKDAVKTKKKGAIIYHKEI